MINNNKKAVRVYKNYTVLILKDKYKFSKNLIRKLYLYYLKQWHMNFSTLRNPMELILQSAINDYNFEFNFNLNRYFFTILKQLKIFSCYFSISN